MQMVRCSRFSAHTNVGTCGDASCCCRVSECCRCSSALSSAALDVAVAIVNAAVAWLLLLLFCAAYNIVLESIVADVSARLRNILVFSDSLPRFHYVRLRLQEGNVGNTGLGRRHRGAERAPVYPLPLEVLRLIS